MYSYKSRLLSRSSMFLNRLNDTWRNHVRFKLSRDKAKYLREKVLQKKGKSIIDNKVLKKIKNYSNDYLGAVSYWPWLALYTELRGQFIEGWIPVDFYRFKLLPKLNPNRFVVFSEEKSVDHLFFGSDILKPMFLRINNIYYDQKGNVIERDSLQKQIKSLNDEIIIKPTSGRGGGGIIFKAGCNVDLKSLQKDTDYIFQKAVKQHKLLEEIYPRSVNTFRVMTFMNEVGVIEVKISSIKFGTGGDRYVKGGDNLIWLPIYPDGKAGDVAYDGMGMQFGSEHPDTGFKFSELNIPYMNKINDICIKNHRVFPYTKVIGWDLYVDKTGEPHLIEWNTNNPGFWQKEALFGPLFSKIDVAGL